MVVLKLSSVIVKEKASANLKTDLLKLLKVKAHLPDGKTLLELNLFNKLKKEIQVLNFCQ